MQELQQLPTMTVALHLLPMAIGGLLFNVIAGKVLHRVNNTILMAVGAVAYFSASLLFSFMRADSIYWAFIFPALVLNVAGADLEFCTGNVRLGAHLRRYWTLTDSKCLDVHHDKSSIRETSNRR